jgi:hypothetical protein
VRKHHIGSLIPHSQNEPPLSGVARFGNERIVPELLSVLLQVFAIRKVLLDGASNLAQTRDILRRFDSARKCINALAIPHSSKRKPPLKGVARFGCAECENRTRDLSLGS